MSEPTATAAPAAEGPSKSELKKRAKEAEKEKKRLEREAKEAEQRAAREAADVDYATANYGKLPLHQSQSEDKSYIESNLTKLSANNVGEPVNFIARVHNVRAQGAKMVFFELRQASSYGNTIQALVNVEPEKVSKHMVEWANALAKESIVQIKGVLQAPLELVRSVSVQDVEVKIQQIHLISPVTNKKGLPFVLEDASRSEADFANAKEGEKLIRVEMATRLAERAFDLRTPTNRAIFRIQDGVCFFFRDFMRKNGFIEIHTPKLQGAATESGASVFKLGYFDRFAYLAQSPQLAKQMCISADYDRVYEVGPVFRAENSNGPRHMTEFTGLDMEMAIVQHYHEAMRMLDGVLKHIFAGLQKEYASEIETVGKQFPCEPFVWKEETVVLRFPEAVQMLRESGHKVVDDKGNETDVQEYEDFATATEKYLGVLVKEKYGTDYFILDKFPSAVRPFYTMPDPEDPNLSNSYDFFMRGEEILSGAQRVHDATLLEANMRKVGIDPDAIGMKEYLDGFRNACQPHAGGGLGMERIVMLFLKLGNIRYASMFPRDPQSFKSAAKLEAPAPVPGAATAPAA